MARGLGRGQLSHISPNARGRRFRCASRDRLRTAVRLRVRGLSRGSCLGSMQCHNPSRDTESLRARYLGWHSQNLELDSTGVILQVASTGVVGEVPPSPVIEEIASPEVTSDVEESRLYRRATGNSRHTRFQQGDSPPVRQLIGCEGPGDLRRSAGGQPFTGVRRMNEHPRPTNDFRSNSPAKGAWHPHSRSAGARPLAARGCSTCGSELRLGHPSAERIHCKRLMGLDFRSRRVGTGRSIDRERVVSQQFIEVIPFDRPLVLLQ